MTSKNLKIVATVTEYFPPMTPEELAGLETLETELPDDFGTNLWSLHRDIGTGFLGGCCGTSTQHVEALAKRYVASDKTANKNSK